MAQTITIDPGSLAQPDLHRYLLEAVAPRPICFASTIDGQGQVNLSPFSFFNVFSSNPPVMIFSPARSGRDNTTKHTLNNVLEVKEVVINIVNFPMVEQMSLASTAYAEGINEFIKAGFTEIASSKVRPPRVGEAPVAFECTVSEVIPLGDQGGAGNLVIAEVVLLHLQASYLDESGFLDTEKLDLIARMGDSWYCRASGEALFEIPKPIRQKGIGVDQLPISIRESTILTGNDLGRLGNVPAFPEPELIAATKEQHQVKALLEAPPSLEKTKAVHRLAQSWLKEHQTMEALALLFLLET